MAVEDHRGEDIDEEESLLTDAEDAVEGESYVVPNYIETDLSKEKRLECRGIVKTINQYGVSQRQKLYLVYLLALELDNRDLMLEISRAVGKAKGSVGGKVVLTAEQAPVKKLILG
jgi:hypothetical protein